MSLQIKTALVVRAAVLAVAACTVLATPAPAAADSEWIFASERQCKARWDSSANYFQIDDQDTTDDDYCYVRHSFQADHDPFSRIAHPQDTAVTKKYPVPGADAYTYVYWKLCKERQNDNDICSNWIRSGT